MLMQGCRTSVGITQEWIGFAGQGHLQLQDDPGNRVSDTGVLRGESLSVLQMMQKDFPAGESSTVILIIQLSLYFSQAIGVGQPGIEVLQIKCIISSIHNIKQYILILFPEKNTGQAGSLLLPSNTLTLLGSKWLIYKGNSS